MVENFITIKEDKENLIVIEKSKFICYIKRVQSEEEVKQLLANIKKKNPFANHNCYAYILDEKGNQTKCSDDGEPQGTAGRPMLEALKKSGLKQVIAVCTRYFGGIKLGTGGLARAYGSSVTECIKNCQIVKYEMSIFCSINISYENYKNLLNYLTKEKIIILNTIFDEGIKIEVVIQSSIFNKFSKDIEMIFNGEKVYKILKEDFFAYDF